MDPPLPPPPPPQPPQQPAASEPRRYAARFSTSSFLHAPLSVLLDYSSGILRAHAAGGPHHHGAAGGGAGDGEVSIQIVGPAEAAPLEPRAGEAVAVDEGTPATSAAEAPPAGGGSGESLYHRYDVQRVARWVEHALPFSLLQHHLRYTPTVSHVHHIPSTELDYFNDSGDSNFLDLEWLSTSGNSSDERSIAISTPDTNLSTENVISDINCEIMIMQSIGFLGPAFFLTQLSHINSPAMAVLCMACSQGTDAFSQSGLYSNHQDIGPRYAGVLLGLSNTTGVLASVFGTAATGYILQHGLA